MTQVPSDPTIDLQDWLKLMGWVQTGGEAKLLIQGEQVRVNGTLETRRRKKLRDGDVVELGGRRERVTWFEEGSSG